MTTKKESLQGKEVLDSKRIGNNTYEYNDKAGNKYIRLHMTDIITFLDSGNIVLNSGGWQTETTKARINEYTPFDLIQRKNIWYVNGVVFYDGITLTPQGKPL